MKPYYHRPGVTVYHADCLDVLSQLETGDADLIFYDPPYGLNVADWDTAFTGQIAADECMRILKEGGSLYATCSPHILRSMMDLFDYRRIISWCKPNLPIRKHLADWDWSTEFVLYVTKGEPVTFNKPRGELGHDYWRIYVENGFLRPDNYYHPARKPRLLLERIVAASSNPNELVIDPMMGSGTTGVACVKTGRRFIGIEIEERYCEIAVKRLAQRSLFEVME